VKRTRPLKAHKLLVASVGVGALIFAACAVFPGCNLMAPPPCSEDPNQYYCRDMSAPDLGAHDFAAPDLRKDTD
jgi:hypothetical protein